MRQVPALLHELPSLGAREVHQVYYEERIHLGSPHQRLVLQGCLERLLSHHQKRGNIRLVEHDWIRAELVRCLRHLMPQRLHGLHRPH